MRTAGGGVFKIPYGIPYGKRDLEVKMPPNMRLVKIALPKDKPGVKNPEETVRKALKNPIGSKPLERLVEPGSKVAIISDDKSRPTPCHIIISVLLDELNAMGVEDDDVSVIVGRGLHPPLTGNALEKKLGKGVVERVAVANHDPNENLVYVGTTSLKTPTYINRLVVDADVKIGLGTIMPHELAGYTGGCGIILPGVAGRTSINFNHRLVSLFKSEFGKIEENLLRKDMEEAAQMAGLNMIINTVLNRGDEMLKVFVGDPILAHREGVKYSRRVFGSKIPHMVDIAVADSHPRDETLGRAIKAVFPSDLITKPGGTIVLVAPCYSGLSYEKEFETILKSNFSQATLHKMINDGELPGESCVLYLFSIVKQRKRIILVSDFLSGKEAHEVGLEYSETVEDALAKVKGRDVVVFPLGSVTLPILS